MTACRDPDILVEIIPDRLLAAQAERLLDVLKPVVYAPHIKGDVLAEVAEDDLQLWVAVEDAVCHHSEDVQTDALGEGERGSYEPMAVLPEFLVDHTSWIPWVQVQRDVELGASLPEDVPLRLVVKDVSLTIRAATLGVVDQSSLETVLGHAAAEFVCCFLRIMHRECSVDVISN